MELVSNFLEVTIVVVSAAPSVGGAMITYCTKYQTAATPTWAYCSNQFRLLLLLQEKLRADNVLKCSIKLTPSDRAAFLLSTDLFIIRVIVLY